MGKLTLKHQSKKITADSGGPWQTIFWPQDNFLCESEDFPIDGSADHCRNVLILSHKGSRDYGVKARLSAALGDALTRTVDLASRACLLRDKHAHLAGQALALFPKHLTVPRLNLSASFSFGKFAQRRPNKRRAISKSRGPIG